MRLCCSRELWVVWSQGIRLCSCLSNNTSTAPWSDGKKTVRGSSLLTVAPPLLLPTHFPVKPIMNKEKNKEGSVILSEWTKNSGHFVHLVNYKSTIFFLVGVVDNHFWPQMQCLCRTFTDNHHMPLVLSESHFLLRNIPIPRTSPSSLTGLAPLNDWLHCVLLQRHHLKAGFVQG